MRWSILVRESLEGLLSHGRIPVPRVVDIVRQVLGAARAAHDFQVSIASIKPDNLFICRNPDGRDFVKILDFGIARSMHDPRLTGTGEVFGTPQYMAPERITSIDAGPAADLYSMGVILYELCTGKLPFEAEDITGYLLKHLRDQAAAPRSLNARSSPSRSRTLIMRDCWRSDPAKRPVDAHQVVRELTAIAATMPKPKPVPMIAEAIPTPMDGIKIMRPHAGTLAPASLERWERRVIDLRADAGARDHGARQAARGPAPVTRRGARQPLGGMADVRQRSMREQEAREMPSGHARGAGALRARDGTWARVSARSLREELHAKADLERQYSELEEKTRIDAVQYRSREGRRLGAGADSGSLRRVVSRGARGAGARAERGRTEHDGASVRARERREVSDTEFQIQELRAQLARLSQSAEDERGEVQKAVEQLGADIAGVEQTLIEDASALANALRGRGELQDLFSELEADAA